MAAELLLRRRVIYRGNAFAELVLWKLPQRVPGSPHAYKYRLAYVVDRVCVLRYDNEAGKGDHRHMGNLETPYRFTTPEALLADFDADIRRWDRDNGDTGSP